MITVADASLHEPKDPLWAETNWFSFQLPEYNLHGAIYVLVRAQHGIVWASVHLNSGWSQKHWEADYCDLQAHLPMGKDFDLLEYRLDNGLHIKTIEPNMEWDVDYDDGEHCQIHFNYRALMAPFDIADPVMDPMAAAAEAGEGYDWGGAYAKGHFDQSGVYEGEIILHGRRMPFRTVSTMDHSWGPRPERLRSSLCWINAHFSENFVVHAICDFDPYSGGRELRFGHGYVLDNGKVIGLAGGSGTVQRNDDWFPREIALDVHDGNGRNWSLKGTAKTSFPQTIWPDVIGFNALVDWRCDGHAGFGQTYDCVGLYDLSAGNAWKAAGK
ncbi:MAG: hypothetical protein ACI915_003642 [Gammaproteobacteria bacterium]